MGAVGQKCFEWQQGNGYSRLGSGKDGLRGCLEREHEASSLGLFTSRVQSLEAPWVKRGNVLLTCAFPAC